MMRAETQRGWRHNESSNTMRAAREAVQTKQAPAARMTVAAWTRGVAQMTRRAAWTDDDGSMDGRGWRHGRTRTAAWTDEDSSMDG